MCIDIVINLCPHLLHSMFTLVAMWSILNFYFQSAIFPTIFVEINAQKKEVILTSFNF